MIGIPDQTELAIEIENRYQLGPQFALATKQTNSRLPGRIGGLEQDRNSHYVSYDNTCCAGARRLSTPPLKPQASRFHNPNYTVSFVALRRRR